MYSTGKITALVMLAGFGLAACQKPSPCDISPPSNKLAGADHLLSCLNTLDRTPVSQMPTSGSATYNGYLVGEFTPSAAAKDTLLGDAVLSVNFAGVGSVNGTVSNISSESYNLGGTLAVSSAAIAGNVFNDNVGGTLTGYGTQTVTFTTSGFGGFLGENAKGILIGSTGSATLSGGYTGTANFTVTGFK